MLTDPALLTWISLAFFGAGLVKGTLGMGLPALSLGTLTTIIGLQPAMAILLVPALVTNAWQALGGGQARVLLRRLWPFLLTATASIQVGTMALTRVNASVLSGLFGALLIVYSLFGLRHPTWRLPAPLMTKVGVVTGIVNGTVGGMTGAFAVPGVPYLQSIGLPRDQLVQAMGMLFWLSTVSLTLGMGRQRLLTIDLALTSVVAVGPTLVGLLIGQRVRRRIPEERFRRVLLSALIALGGYIIVRSAW